MASTERRVTVLRTIWPHLEALAKRDGATVAEVTNAILLQTVMPYGTAPACHCSGSSGSANGRTHNQHPQPSGPDPYETVSIDSW